MRILVYKSMNQNSVIYNVRRSLLATLSSLLVVSCTQSAEAGTELRLGGSLPFTTIVFSEHQNFGVGTGMDLFMDIQKDPESSYFISVLHNSISGSPALLPNSTEISQTPHVSDWGFSVGSAYYPIQRKDVVSPVFAAEFGLRFVSETIERYDRLTQTTEQSVNQILFNCINVSAGAEFQVDSKLSLQSKVRMNINMPATDPRALSFVFSPSAFNYLQLQFLLSAQYRLTK